MKAPALPPPDTVVDGSPNVEALTAFSLHIFCMCVFVCPFCFEIISFVIVIPIYGSFVEPVCSSVVDDDRSFVSFRKVSHLLLDHCLLAALSPTMDVEVSAFSQNVYSKPSNILRKI